ncbi:Type 1 glutamine amidotransferase-like domain-containing protein [Amnibacterium sp.]|uniref:Type 1 glutamine amidotransferase-like domain-containing protein n=1 Tax=Amnibacterium sp. TaxID=1872496 RepID=UPI00261DCB3B|nr:Type 1 glutamine amidotransferase-like domain-containing protein [Amnibacterium sp.]MCU1474431.1 peptidase [Amnibacterium sp.]
MSGRLHLAGGGWSGTPEPWRAFLADARAAGGRERPRIAVLAVRNGDEREHVERLVAALTGPVDPRVATAPHGGALDAAVLDDVDGVLVGGGLTPAYLDAVLPLAERIRALVADGRPYAGFSAGSSIAARHALLGGWRHDGVPVVDEEIGEDLGELLVRDGLGLTDLTIDVHAAQWGTLARLITAVGGGLVPEGAAIDEDTVLVLGDVTTVGGTGNVWWVSSGDGAVAVRREPAA